MVWKRVCIETTEAASDIVASLLMDAGASGVEIEGGSNPEAQNDEYAPSSSNGSDVIVSAYFGDESDPALRFLRDELETLKSISDMGTLRLNIERADDNDWNDNFRKHFKTFRAAGRIVVKPTWEDYNAENGDIVIEMDPGMAFGSGEHETTKMCLEIIQKYMNRGASVLDIGCGSGILGIACAKLGADKVLSVDNDDVCVRVTEENAQLNRVENIRVQRSDLISSVGEEKFDIITANIVADVIIRLNEGIARYMKSGSVYIISGIIKDRCCDAITSLEKNGLSAMETRSTGDWIAVTARLSQ